MTEETKVPSGKPDESASGDQQEKQTVAYESYQKVLSEKKNLQAKFGEVEKQMNALLEQQRKAEEEKLNEQGDLKAVVEFKDKKLKEFQEQLKALADERDSAKKNLQDTWKLQAFYEKLPGRIKKTEYLNFIDLDSIVIDPETREVDRASVDSAVSNFMENYSDLVQTKQFKSLPSDAPKGAAKKPLSQMNDPERRLHLRGLLDTIVE